MVLLDAGTHDIYPLDWRAVNDQIDKRDSPSQVESGPTSRSAATLSMNCRHQLAPNNSFRLNRYTTIAMFASRMSTRTGCTSRTIS
jgi:hypothetical protein